MKRANRYGVRSLKKDFPSDEACLAYLFDQRHSRTCSCGGTYRPIKGRRQFQCSKCRFQIAPTANTIFHKSDTPLTLWFHAILLFSNAKSGLSAKYLERELEVTYKTAYRMLKLIREALGEDPNNNGKLRGGVEVDTAYFGGRGYAGKNNEDMKNAMRKKKIVIAAVERGGHIRAAVVDADSTDNVRRFLQKNIQREEANLYTDGTNRFPLEYSREKVNHNKNQYVVGEAHVNTLETFFAHVKRSITGTHKVISRKNFQSYLDGFVFGYNNRHSDKARFQNLLSVLLPRIA